MELRKLIAETIAQLHQNLEKKELESGEMIYHNVAFQVLSQSGVKFDFIIDDDASAWHQNID